MQDGLTGSAWGDWANYTASPLRAFENELGVQAIFLPQSTVAIGGQRAVNSVVRCRVWMLLFYMICFKSLLCRCSNTARVCRLTSHALCVCLWTKSQI